MPRLSKVYAINAKKRRNKMSGKPRVNKTMD